jgi:molybdopterin-guanine dinucleotide biosynthesis protein A
MLRAAVLAGGRSSRMGQDKALLQWQGQSWLDRAITLLQDSGADVVYVSGRRDHALGVEDLFPHHGPPGAILSLLAWLDQRGQLDGEPLLVIPVDMPLLRQSTLQRLLAASEGQAVHYRGEIFPCVLPASKALHAHLQALFASEDKQPGGNRSMRALLQFAGALAIEPDGIDAVEFHNVNTPQELELVLASTTR